MTEVVQSKAKRNGLRGFGGAFCGALLGVFLVCACMIFPFAGITKTNPLHTHHWQELSLFYISFAGAALALGRVLSSDADIRNLLLRRNLQLSEELAAVQAQERFYARVSKFSSRFAWLLGLLFFFLYCAAIALCMRLRICSLEVESAIVAETIRSVGLAVVICAVAFQLKAIFGSFTGSASEHELTRFTSVFKIRHPVLLGWVALLMGLPLVFGIWMPLIAIPGCYIGIRWWVRKQDARLREQFDEAFDRFAKQTWSIVPYLN